MKRRVELYIGKPGQTPCTIAIDVHGTSERIAAAVADMIQKRGAMGVLFPNVLHTRTYDMPDTPGGEPPPDATPPNALDPYLGG